MTKLPVAAERVAGLWPNVSSPQHSTTPLPRSAHVWRAPELTPSKTGSPNTPNATFALTVKPLQERPIGIAVSLAL